MWGRGWNGTFEDLHFEGNSTTGWGGAVWVNPGVSTFRNCTIVNCSAARSGGGIWVGGPAGYPQFHLENTIVAFCTGGPGLGVYDGAVPPSVSCTDLYGNSGGDWVGCIADQAGLDGNFSADPLFCDPENGNFTIQSNSPCAPPGATGCGLIGALPVGCGPVSVESESWGRIKGRYR